MKSTEVLMAEHRVIERVLDCLEKASAQIDAGTQVRPEFFLEASEFIREFADTHHHKKEEDVLFEEMTSRGFPKEGGPIGVMLTEHEAGRQFNRAMRDAAERWQAGDSGASAEVVRNAREFAALLRQHIAKEDQVLFPMAGQVLAADDQARVDGIVEQMEAEETSVQRRQKFVALAEALEREVESMQ